MKLNKLTLQNFQGIRSAEIDFSDSQTNIFGDNATGKTTILNAWTWLLIGKAGNGAKNYNPKTKSADGDVHNLEHAAEAVITTDTGRRLTLKKVFRETYKKKRGSASEEFTGHTIDYFVDGVPAKESEYSETIKAEIGEPEIVAMLTMPNHFPASLTWDKRREILIDIAGEISDESIIAANKELADLPEVLKMPGSDESYTVEDYTKIAAASKKNINRHLQEIPSRIDEATLAMPDLSNCEHSKTDIAKEITRLEEVKAKLAQEQAERLTGDTTAQELRQRKADIQARMSERRAAHAEKENQKRAAVMEKVKECHQDLQNTQKHLSDMENELYVENSRLASANRERERLLEEYKKQSAIRWNPEDETCPTCKRRLPEDEIEKYISDFNKRKSETLENINAEGKKCSKEVIADIEKRIEQLKFIINGDKDEIRAIEDHIKNIESSAEYIEWEHTAEYSNLQKELAEAMDQEAETNDNRDAIRQEYTFKFEAINKRLSELKETEALFTLKDSQERRIVDLEAEEKRLAAEYEKMEHGLYLCELFTREKAKMLTESINSKFENVKFRLFIEQINGGLREDCEVMIPSPGGSMVPYPMANNAAQINAGLEIINALSGYYKKSLPVFIDNAESVTKLADTGSQIIRLVVSESDKKIRIEKE